MTDDDTRAFPQEPRTSPIPLRKPPRGEQGPGNSGGPDAASGVVVSVEPGRYSGGPRQGYPHPNPQQGGYPHPGNPQQGYRQPLQWQSNPYQQGAVPPAYGPGGYPPQHYPQPVGYAPAAYGPSYNSTALMTRPGPNGALVAIAWIVAVLTVFYMLPWAVAATRGKSNQGAVGLLNFFLGWSLIGWIVALVMACTSEPQPIVMVQQNHYGNGYHR